LSKKILMWKILIGSVRVSIAHLQFEIISERNRPSCHNQWNLKFLTMKISTWPPFSFGELVKTQLSAITFIGIYNLLYYKIIRTL